MLLHQVLANGNTLLGKLKITFKGFAIRYEIVRNIHVMQTPKTINVRIFVVELIQFTSQIYSINKPEICQVTSIKSGSDFP